MQLSLACQYLDLPNINLILKIPCQVVLRPLALHAVLRILNGELYYFYEHVHVLGVFYSLQIQWIPQHQNVNSWHCRSSIVYYNLSVPNKANITSCLGLCLVIPHTNHLQLDRNSVSILNSKSFSWPNFL